MAVITRPQMMGLLDWTDQVNQDLQASNYVSRLDDENKWQEWALGLIQSPSVSGFNPPNPLQYSDWREWAERFVEVVL